MKILHVMAGAKHGGAETAFVDTCIAMKEAGFEIEVATRPNQRNERLAGIKVHELPFGGALDLYTTFRLKQIIRAFEPVIVQTWMSRAARKTPGPGADKKYLKVSRLGGYYAMKYFKSTNYFITIAPDIKSYLIKNGIAAERIAQINNLAETENVAAPLAKTDLQTPETATVLLTLSRLHESKALDVLLKAAKDLPDMHVWLAGEGPLREELEALAEALGISGRVRFLGWRNDRAALLKACDICVFPSRYEPFGTVFAQAWGARTPVITSDADGPRQFVRPEEDALVFPIDDVEALKRAIARLSGDKGLRDKLAAAGYRRYLDEFTREKTMEAYRDFYADILSRESLIR